MSFWKKKPKRLYYPVKSNWYTRPKRRAAIRRPRKTLSASVNEMRKAMKKYAFWTASAAGMLVLILFFVFSSYFSIKNIEVNRQNFNVDSAAIENEMSQFIGRNILFFSRSSIYDVIQKKFPEFSGVQIHKLLPSTIKIELESQPIIANLKAYYILPEPEPEVQESFDQLNRAIQELSSGNSDAEGGDIDIKSPIQDKKIAENVFTLDENKPKPEPVEQKCLLNSIGQAIFDQEENLELMTITIHGLTQPIKDRDIVIPKDQMDLISGTIQYYKNIMGLDILGIEYLPVAREIHIKTVNNLILWISLDRGYKDQIDKLQTIYKAAELNKEDIAYIDLRIKEKVIYCPRHARCDK